MYQLKRFLFWARPQNDWVLNRSFCGFCARSQCTLETPVTKSHRNEVSRQTQMVRRNTKLRTKRTTPISSINKSYQLAINRANTGKPLYKKLTHLLWSVSNITYRTSLTRAILLNMSVAQLNMNIKSRMCHWKREKCSYLSCFWDCVQLADPWSAMKRCQFSVKMYYMYRTI